MALDATPLQKKMVAAVLRLEAGEVVSFGDVARAAGRPDASRAAGAVLASAEAFDLPWWRVVYADGRLPRCNPGLQTERLIDEGVEVQGDRVLRSPRGRFAESG
jgi:methylated-DNA-protein-cysteine methyltransferase-like protein